MSSDASTGSPHGTTMCTHHSDDEEHEKAPGHVAPQGQGHARLACGTSDHTICTTGNSNTSVDVEFFYAFFSIRTQKNSSFSAHVLFVSVLHQLG